MLVTASIKKFSREYGHGRANYINGPLVAGASSLPAKSDQVISCGIRRRPSSGRAPDPGLKPQDNNVSFEGISEAEYNKRHMKALKDADPGFKRQASSGKH